MYVVYQHRRKDNGQIFYIGQGKLERAYESINNRRNRNWANVVLEAGGFDVDILVDMLTKDESLKIEAEYISKYGTIKHGTGILVNERLSGTRGMPSGYKHSDEKKREISEKTKKAMQNPEVYSKHMDSHIKYWQNPESRVKASKAMKGVMSGEKHPNYGKKLKPETIERMKATKLNKKKIRLSNIYI
jgi:hypothetical protein